MKRIIITVVFFISVWCSMYGQLHTQYCYPSTLASSVISQFAGQGVQISNVQFTGYNLNVGSEIRDIGIFNGQNTSLGVDSGIILTSGFLAPFYGLGVSAYNTADFVKNTY